MTEPKTISGWAAQKAAERQAREKLIIDAVGDDPEASHCGICGEPTTPDNLSGVDEDGNLYCVGPHIDLATGQRRVWPVLRAG